jgi:hypothetical protein
MSSHGGAIGRARRRGLAHATENHLRWGFAQKKARAVGIITGEFLVNGDERKTTCDSEAQVSTFSDGGGELLGTALNAVGQNGCGEEFR